jgi:signal transduction histidine kinase/CheY-like chemotaxis protein
MPLCNKQISLMKVKWSVLLVFAILFIVNNSLVFAQDVKKIDELKSQLEIASPKEKANILKSISDEYESYDSEKQIEYARKIVELPDDLVDENLKGQMYELLAKYYNSRNSDLQSQGNKYEINYLSLGVFIISLGVFIVVIAMFLVKLKKYRLLNHKLEVEAERVYNEKYEKLKLVETKLTKELQPLKDEVLRVEKQETKLKKMLKNLEEANYLKNAFLSNMSHQIRTSLNGISGFANILETELAIMADENLFSYAQKIQQSGNKLENLLTNIIDISRLEANVDDKHIKDYNIDEVISAVEGMNTFKANEKGIVFKTKIDNPTPIVLADKEKLTKVVNVLVDNAVKYTNKGFVTIAASLLEERELVKIEVKDTGIGIQNEYADLINKAFVSKMDDHDKSYQGIGIGLKLCKRFVDLMDGSISMKTTKTRGTSFTILLPASAKFESMSETKEVEKPVITLINAPELGSLDIFIVEDDRMNRMVLEKMLKKSGSVTTAVDGDDAMRLMKKGQKRAYPYHVMLFDINLPAPWDGTRLMQEIRRQYPEYRNVPFIAQTAYAMAGDKNRFLEAGFDDYIAKPIMKNELLTLIEKQLEKFAEKIN